MQQKCGVWELSQEIGRGAYGVVYMATGPGGERAAVKVCRRDDAGDERYGRELRGAKLFMSLPPREGLVRMRELAEEEWGFYTVMDLADDEFGGSGGTTASYRPKTLARVIEGEKALPLRECVKLAITLAKGLVELQRHHLLHRDIKPANVLYVGGRPVLSDPGLVVEEAVAVSTVGTPGYVPPERKFTDAAGDIYSLGLTLKAASFGRQLEDLDKGPAMEADTGSLLFPVWWRILNKATDSTPAKRHQSAKALLRDLMALRRKMRVSAVLGSRMAKAAIVAGAIAVVTVVILAVASSRRAQRELAEASGKYKSAAQFQAREQEKYALRLLKFLDDGARGTVYTDPEALGIPREISASDFEVFPVVTAAERKRRDFFWEACAAGKSPYRAKLRVSEAKEKVAKVIQANRDIAKIRAVDAARADELQSLYDKVVELVAKIDALQEEFDILHREAREKVGKGIDDIEELIRACVIAKKLYALSEKTDNATGHLG
ncbi:MAG: protein kinase, partial [Kiritimatiellae bacterium]|nr:protein kinase [Kiritimatiellia bacterium]